MDSPLATCFDVISRMQSRFNFLYLIGLIHSVMSNPLQNEQMQSSNAKKLTFYTTSDYCKNFMEHSKSKPGIEQLHIEYVSKNREVFNRASCGISYASTKLCIYKQ